MLHASIASHTGGNYGLAMAIVAGSVAIIIAVMIYFGKETKNTTFADQVSPAASSGGPGASSTGSQPSTE